MTARYGNPKRLVRNGTKSEFYYCRVNDGGRRTWKSTGAPTRELADEVLATWRLRDAQGERHAKAIGFKEAADTWLAAKGDRVSPSCETVYRVYVNSWGRYFKAKPLRSVEAADLEKYLRLRSRKVKPRSLNNERATLSSFFRFARRRHWTHENPVEGVEVYREAKRTIRVLDEPQEEKFLEECKAGGDDLYGFTLTLTRSGLRRGTVAQLEWGDIDWTAGEWAIPGAKMKSREDFFGRPVAPDLLAYLTARRKPAGLIFGRLDSKRFQAAAKRSGASWLRPHDLRRGFVSACRRQGIAMEITMHLSDHRDLATVLASYRAVDPAEVKAAMQRLAGGKAVAS